MPPKTLIPLTKQTNDSIGKLIKWYVAQDMKLHSVKINFLRGMHNRGGYYEKDRKFLNKMRIYYNNRFDFIK